MNFNKDQQEAINHKNGPVVVIAGAGSGKTAVLTYRMAKLIESGVRPNSILLLTFTKKAATNMTERARAITNDAQYVTSGTFHSFAIQILKRYGKNVGLQNFTVLDLDDEQALIESCIEKMNLREEVFPSKEICQTIFSTSINKEIPIKDILVENYPDFSHCEQDLISLQEQVMKRKFETQTLVFDDMLLYLDLLLENESIKKKINDYYQYVMVDEYQDTNRLQESIVSKLGAHGNIMVVGDPAQSIYGFRGAEFTNIFHFEQLFPAKRIFLSKNYRSTEKILGVANRIDSNMKSRYDRVVTGVRGEGSTPVLVECRDNFHQAEKIANRVIKTYGENVKFSEQAVIVRMMHQTRVLENEFTKRKIPYTIIGGVRLNETAHMKDWISFLKIIYNPKDYYSWFRVLSSCSGIGSKTINTFLKDVDDVQTALSKYLYSKAKVKNNTRVVFEILEKLVDSSNPIQDSVKLLEPFWKMKYKDYKERMVDIQMVAESNTKPLDEFIITMSLEPMTAGNSVQEDRVLIITAHGSKGLEFKTVHLPDFQLGIWPSARASSEKDLEEEQRCFYVACTRAENQLFLYQPLEQTKYGERTIVQESPYWQYLKGTVIKKSLPREETQDGAKEFRKRAFEKILKTNKI